ncbi:MAG: 7,8-didemethyl-8-hydroxy-5-deazariboflavin synthase CofG [Candidatus Bathyarchaeia archaeon]
MKLPEGVREVLDKAAGGGGIEREEAYQLMHIGEEHLPALTSTALKVRLHGRGITTSFSRKAFIPLTNLCRNACRYCGFRKTPKDTDAKLMTPKEVLKIAKQAMLAGCNEALFTLGEKPEEVYPEVRERLRALGYENTIAYLYDACKLVIEETGLIPHSNAGILTPREMAELREVNASMGLMLESISERLCGEGGPHELSPGKKPKRRLSVIEDAGRQRVAFTTGLLIGIGETLEERVDSLFAIKKLHEQYGHIQEVLIQNFKARVGTPMEKSAEPSSLEVTKTLAVARLILGGEVNIQAPPNLNSEIQPILLQAGVNDWGGISPVTIDYINPEAPWPSIDRLKEVTERAGFVLKERLPIYPEFITKKQGFIPEGLKDLILSRIDEEGYVKVG